MARRRAPVRRAPRAPGRSTAPVVPRPQPHRAPKLAALAAAAALAAGCEAPIAPQWETTWVVPSDSMTLPVSQLLPAGVTLSDDGGAFLLTLGPVRTERTLGDLCPACQAADGDSVPKPAFAATIESGLALPAGVVSVTVAGGEVLVDLSHEYNFDPIVPGPVTGYIGVVLAAGGSALAADTVSGASETFPAGATRTIRLALPETTLTDSLLATVGIDSPEGDSVRLDASHAFRSDLRSDSLLLSAAEVEVADRAIESEPAALELADVPESVVGRVRSGALRLEIANPFGVAGTLDLTITTPTTTIAKSIELAAGESAPRVEFTADELRAVLGVEGVTLATAGIVTAPSGTVVLSPSQVLVIRSRLELTLGLQED